MYSLLRRVVRSKMSSQHRRLSSRKSKHKSALARTKSLGNLASLNSNRHVVPRLAIESAPAATGGVAKGARASSAHPLVREYEAIMANWSRFDGMPMHMLLLVRRQRLPLPLGAQLSLRFCCRTFARPALQQVLSSLVDPPKNRKSPT